LAAPTGLTAAIARTNRITLSWNDASTSETGFAVWRSVDGGSAMQIGTVTRSTTQGSAVGGALVTFVDNTAFVLGATYNYYVTAINGPGVSNPSNVFSVPFLAPLAPDSLTASVSPSAGSNSRSDVSLNWQSVPGATTYTLQVQAPGSTNWSTLVNNLNVLGYNNTRVRKTANGTVYTYQVRANSAAGSSTWVQLPVAVN
jgi:hypothetical protein